MDTGRRLTAAGVITSHLSFLGGLGLLYWWMSSLGITEFERLFWGIVAVLGGFCFIGYFSMKRSELMKKEILERIEALEKMH